jgi:hypothetical protein
MALAGGEPIRQPQQPDRVTAEKPSAKGKVVPPPAAAKPEGDREQDLTEQEMVAVLNLLLM